MRAAGANQASRMSHGRRSSARGHLLCPGKQHPRRPEAAARPEMGPERAQRGLVPRDAIEAESGGAGVGGAPPTRQGAEAAPQLRLDSVRAWCARAGCWRCSWCRCCRRGGDLVRPSSSLEEGEARQALPVGAGALWGVWLCSEHPREAVLQAEGGGPGGLGRALLRREQK